METGSDYQFQVRTKSCVHLRTHATAVSSRKILISFLSFVADTPEPPFNLTIESLDSTSVSITWKVHDKYTYAIQSLELTIHSIPDDRVTSSRVQFAETTTERLSGRDRSAALQGLHPATQYQIHIVAVSTHDKKSNMSEIITFRTLPGNRFEPVSRVSKETDERRCH